MLAISISMMLWGRNNTVFLQFFSFFFLIGDYSLLKKTIQYKRTILTIKRKTPTKTQGRAIKAKKEPKPQKNGKHPNTVPFI